MDMTGDYDEEYAKKLLFTKDEYLKTPGGVIPLKGRKDEVTRKEAMEILNTIERNRKANEKARVVPKGFKFGN